MVSKTDGVDLSSLPRHIAIIMDGNGRWAQKRSLPRIFGHKAGVAAVRGIVEECSTLGIAALTLYAFSTENWSRPVKEVSGLMKLLEQYLTKELNRLVRNNIQLRVIGDREKLPESVQKKLSDVIAATSNNTGMSLVLALNYGGRHEILRAVQNILKSGVNHVTEEEFARHLDTTGLPDPDLVIRTSGEKRISNLLLWQIAYSEFYFTDVLWPDFDKEELYRAIREYQRRDRRFGGV